MKFIKKHKVLLIVLTLILIMLVLFSMYAYSYQQNKNRYGNRLNGIENVIITDDKIENIKEKVLTNEICDTVTYKQNGKIIKFFIEVNLETDELTLESIFNSILEEFSDSEKKFYDFEIFVTNNSKSYIVAAYKHKNSEVFSITRKEVVEDEK